MRLRDWQSRLQALIRERESADFQYGTFDCATFAADAVLATTGVDPIADLRGTYKTKVEALRVLGNYGGLVALADMRLVDEVPVRAVHVGDIGIVSTPEGEALAVWGGSSWLAPMPHGLGRAPLDAARIAWRGECRS